MNKRSKVVSVQANGTWQLKDGSKTFYKYEIVFENGDCGEYSSISAEQNKFVEGQEVDYIYDKSKPEFPKVKPVSNFQQGGNFTPAPKSDKVQEYIVKQSSLKAAVDYVIANGGDTKTVIDTAEVFTNWVLKGDKPTSAPSSDMPF